MLVSPVDIWTELVLQLTAVADAHLTPPEAFKMETRTRDHNLKGWSDYDRNDIMGDPVRYGRIEFADLPDFNPETGDVNGKPIFLPVSFIVGFWWQWVDADSYAASSESDWHAFLWQSQNPGPVGVLRYLFETNCITVDGQSVSVGNPQGVVYPLVELNAQQFEWAHHVSFMLTLT